MSAVLSTLFTFAEIGVRHIVSPDALDHLLFLLALAAIYRKQDWRPALAVVTAFTVGHSLSLALVASGRTVVPAHVIEFLIPVTIAAAGVENLWQRRQLLRGTHSRARPVFAALFGLVHGAGFAGYLDALSVGGKVLPLLGFNLGIEVGQVVVLAVAGIVLFAIDALLTRVAKRLAGAADVHTGFDWRLVSVSVGVTVVATRIAVSRWPWMHG